MQPPPCGNCMLAMRTSNRPCKKNAFAERARAGCSCALTGGHFGRIATAHQQPICLCMRSACDLDSVTSATMLQIWLIRSLVPYCIASFCSSHSPPMTHPASQAAGEPCIARRACACRSKATTDALTICTPNTIRNSTAGLRLRPKTNAAPQPPKPLLP